MIDTQKAITDLEKQFDRNLSDKEKGLIYAFATIFDALTEIGSEEREKKETEEEVRLSDG